MKRRRLYQAFEIGVFLKVLYQLYRYSHTRSMGLVPDLASSPIEFRESI